MEYEHDRYKLNKFCEFRNREVESDFMEYEKKSSLKTVRLLILIMGFTFSMFSITDFFYYYGEGKAFYISLGLRFTSILVAVSSFILAGKLKHYHHVLLMVTLAELTVFGLFLLILVNQEGREPILTFMTMVLFVLTVFMIPNVFKNCMAAGCIIIVSYIVFCYFLGHPDERPPVIHRGIYLLVCFISSAIFLYGRETSNRKQYTTEKLLEYMSITDKLTGIYNRGRFEYILSLWIKNMRHDPFCLLLFDIDNFKDINDRFGHSTGDQVLIETAEVVGAKIRDSDILARWGGEEFVILYSNTSLDRAVELAERIRKAVEAKHGAGTPKATISIGVAQYRRPETILDFVNRADAKMYEAKNAGKNCVKAEDPPAGTV